MFEGEAGVNFLGQNMLSILSTKWRLKKLLIGWGEEGVKNY